MIIVIAPFKTKQGERGNFVRAAKPCVEATRKESGCIMYELHLSTDNDQDLIFVEKWRDRDALREHLDSAHIKKFSEDRTPFWESSGEVELFEAARESL